MKKECVGSSLSVLCLSVFEFLSIMNNEVFVVRTLDFIATCMCFGVNVSTFHFDFFPFHNLYICLRKVRRIGIG